MDQKVINFYLNECTFGKFILLQISKKTSKTFTGKINGNEISNGTISFFLLRPVKLNTFLTGNTPNLARLFTQNINQNFRTVIFYSFLDRPYFNKAFRV